MDGQVVKNLTVDAKLFLHLVLPRAGTFRHRNFFIARKATVQFWVTLRSQEGSHEKSFSYPENCAFSKLNRTFDRRSGQLRASRRSWWVEYPHCGWGTAASAHPTASEARCCLDCGRRPTPASHPAAPEARNRPDRGRSSTAAADSTVTKALGGVIRAEGKRAL